MFRASFAAILGAVAATNATNATTATTTESPLAAAVHAKESALEQANQTLHSIMREKQESHDQADDQNLVDQEVASIEAAVPNTTHHFPQQRKHLLHERQHARKQEVDEEVHAAKTAANAYKHAARALETQRRHAGLHESFYESAWDHDENLAEGWHDEAENNGDAADDYIEAFYDAVADKIEKRAEAEQSAMERAMDQQDHQDQQGNRGAPAPAPDDHQDQQDDNDAPAPAPASGPAPSTPDVVNAVNAPLSNALNLRAVAQNQRKDGQGVLMTFACIGFLASMAFAVQMQRHPTRSPAREPLLVLVE